MDTEVVSNKKLKSRCCWSQLESGEKAAATLIVAKEMVPPFREILVWRNGLSTTTSTLNENSRT